MNALVRKEVTLLLPSFLIGLAAVLAIGLIPVYAKEAGDMQGTLGILAIGISPGLLVLMTMASFGRELSNGTFSFLLSQPVPRGRIWWTKALLLAAAAAILWVGWWLALSSNPNFRLIPKPDQNDAFLTAILFTLVVYSGGLWTTVFFRQLAAAFWFTLLTPASIALLMVAVMGKNTDEPQPALTLALILSMSLYSIAGFVLGRWLFLRAQDAPWTGGEITLPNVDAWRGWSRRRSDRRHWRPNVALWTKDFQLHQPQFLLAGLLALLHLTVIGVRNFGGDFKSSPALEFVLQNFWVLWYAMPLLVGAAAVAEERRLGTMEAQLCLPARRRTQFAIKFISMLLLSLGLGIGMPLLLEGTRILPDYDALFTSNPNSFGITTATGSHISFELLVTVARTLLPWLTLVGIAIAVTLASFYASTLARSSMQALAPALFSLVIAQILWLAASEVELFVHYPLWDGPLVYLVGIPVMVLVLGGLMYWNFKRVPVGWPVWRRNALLWVAALGGITMLTTATYHRVWERFMTLEPPHGPARLDRSRPFVIGVNSYRVTIPVLDGRIWSSWLTMTVPDVTTMLSGDWKVSEIRGSNGFLDGTNWMTVIRSYRDTIGIQKDGSLWVSGQREVVPTPGSPAPPPNPVMIRLGHDSDWRAVAVSGFGAFLLKTNGTLWRLGTNRADWAGWPGYRAFTPTRLGTDSDWATIRKADPGGMIFEKTNGSAWVNQPINGTPAGEEQLRLDTDVTLSAAPYLAGQKSAVAIWAGSRLVQIGVGDDGLLRVIAGWNQETAAGSRVRYGWRSQNVPLGHGTNWLTLVGNYRNRDLAALKSDGTLWMLDFPADPLTEPNRFSAAPLSIHSDWVAIIEVMGGMGALAADGSLWYWALEERSLYPSSFTIKPLLAASRRPQLIGNVFASDRP